MQLIIVKFGGSSLNDMDAVRAAASRIAMVRQQADAVVAVVSAMGSTTDKLVKMAKNVNPNPSPRELDMLLSSGEQISIALLAMALESLGQGAVSFTGAQIGLQTNRAHTRARILNVDCNQIRRILDDGKVAVVAGFQGVTETGQITTLGRGGSDTTAVALAAALDAQCCEILTDVDGVYTADPRIVDDAHKINRISYDEMLELAVLGAGVMHPRSVFFGKKYDIPIHVRNARHLLPGTLITGDDAMMEEPAVVGCALKEDLGRITLLGLPAADGIQADIFAVLAEAEIFVDDIIQNTAGADRVNISFTVDHHALADVKPAMEALLREVGQGELDIDIALSKVSVVGLGMNSQTGVAARMFAALKQAKVAIANITTSEIKISCIVNRNDGRNALKAVHRAFKLDNDDHIRENTDSLPESIEKVGSPVSPIK